ncbi:MAG: hypothetical protein AAB463_00440 [Patescibacteria group bacterium]
MGHYSFSISRTWLTAIVSTFAFTIGALALFQSTLSAPGLSSLQADLQPLSCNPKSPVVAPGQDLIVLAEGGTPPYQWSIPNAPIAYMTTADSVAIVAFATGTSGKQEIVITSKNQTAQCSVIVR